MARLRKAAKIWRNPEAQSLANRVMVPHGDALFAVEPTRLFFRPAPLEVEFGAGKGDFIIERAASAPERNFLAIELANSVARMLAVRVGRSELPNVRVLLADARPVANLFLPDRSVAAYHIYFPDPWPKERQIKHRLFTPRFVRGIERTLDIALGRVFVATDVEDYARDIFAMLTAGGLERVDEPAAGARRSNFGRKYAEAGKAVFSGVFRLSPMRSK